MRATRGSSRIKLDRWATGEGRGGCCGEGTKNNKAQDRLWFSQTQPAGQRLAAGLTSSSSTQFPSGSSTIDIEVP
jgi:hypothetical protein